MPADAKGRSRVMQWLMFQMGGIGPMMGQANVFFRYFPEKIQPAIDRYQAEVKRLFDGAGRPTARTTSTWPATIRSPTSPTGRGCAPQSGPACRFDDLPHLTRWIAQIRARPAVQVGILQPPSKLSGSEEDAEKARRFIEEARKMIVTGAGAPDAE